MINEKNESKITLGEIIKAEQIKKFIEKKELPFVDIAPSFESIVEIVSERLEKEKAEPLKQIAKIHQNTGYLAGKRENSPSVIFLMRRAYGLKLDQKLIIEHLTEVIDKIPSSEIKRTASETQKVLEYVLSFFHVKDMEELKKQGLIDDLKTKLKNCFHPFSLEHLKKFILPEELSFWKEIEIRDKQRIKKPERKLKK